MPHHEGTLEVEFLDGRRHVAYAIWIADSDRGMDWSRVGRAVDDPHLPAPAPALEPALERCLAQGAAR